MKSYLTLLCITMKNQLFSPSILMTRALFLILMILVFNQFWLVLKATNNTAITLEPTHFVWYLLIGAVLQFSRPEGLHKQIEDDVKTGNIAYQMVRPVHIVLIYFCRSFGTFLIRMPILLFMGGVFLYFLTGFELPPALNQFPVIFLLMLLSACFASLCTVFIGLFALFIHDSLPLFWVFQKCEYVLGGVFFPIVFYPTVFYSFCLLTPFGWSIYGVAHLIYDYSPQAAWSTFIHLFCWTVFAGCVVALLWNYLKKRICVYG